MRFSLGLLLAVLGLLSLSPSSNAASVLLLTDAEQARISDAVIVCRVLTQRVERSPELGRPVTRSEIAVEEVLFGEAPARLTLTQLKGSIDGRTVALPGSAVLKADERVVLFLRKQDGAWMTTALEQSKYTVRVGRFGPVLVRDRLSSDLYVREPGAGLKRVDEPVKKPVVTLDGLRAALKALR